MPDRNRIESLETQLASLLGRRYCVVVGRATTAIYLALRAIRPRRGDKVIVPALLCPQPANAVLYAGLEPLFADVDRADGTLSVESCSSILQRERGVVGLVAAHLYGHPVELEEIQELADRFGLVVIEDAAQSIGGTYKGRLLGSFGDVSVLSFGHTKIIDAGWGGALLTDREDIASAARRERERLPARTTRTQARIEEYRDLYYALEPFLDRNRRVNELFLSMPDIYREIFLQGDKGVPADVIQKKLDDLPSVVQARRQRAARYSDLLRHPAIVPFTPREGWVPWRYSFQLVGRDRQSVLGALRAQRMDVSSWYRPIHRWYRAGLQRNGQAFPNAVTIGRQVVNLWVSPELSMERIDETAGLLLGLLDQLPVSHEYAESH